MPPTVHDDDSVLLSERRNLVDNVIPIAEPAVEQDHLAPVMQPQATMALADRG